MCLCEVQDSRRHASGLGKVGVFAYEVSFGTARCLVSRWLPFLPLDLGSSTLHFFDKRENWF